MCNKSTRRVAIPFRPWTQAQWLLRKCKVSQRDIAEQSGVELASVNRALSIRFFHRTNFGSVTKVRRAVEQLLQESCDEYIDFAELWNEYDRPLFVGED